MQRIMKCWIVLMVMICSMEVMANPVYNCHDSEGRVIFSDQPCNNEPSQINGPEVDRPSPTRKAEGTAATPHVASANFGIGINLYRSGEIDKAFPYLLKAAEEGNSEAQYRIGDYYYRGLAGHARNLSQTRLWFERAAQQGDVNAQRDIGKMYLFGEGVKPDAAIARKWLTFAAAQGDSQSRIMVSALKVDNDAQSNSAIIDSQEKARQEERPYLTEAESRAESSVFDLWPALTVIAVTVVILGIFAYNGMLRRRQKYLKQDHTDTLQRLFPQWPERPAHFSYHISLWRIIYPVLCFLGMTAWLAYNAVFNHEGMVIRGINIPPVVASSVAGISSVAAFYVVVLVIATAIKRSRRSAQFILHSAQLEALQLVDSDRQFIPYLKIEELRLGDTNSMSEVLTIIYEMGRQLTVVSVGFKTLEEYLAFKQILVMMINRQ